MTEWNMRKEYEVAYEKAKEVLNRIIYPKDCMIRTASVIDAVEEITKVDVKFTDFDFSKLKSDTTGVDFSSFGAAMRISEENDTRTARILLNSRETPAMKRFSLVHELGHLITEPMESESYRVSTHIDMDITSISEDVLNEEGNEFLIKEQIANIFALLVLIPSDMLAQRREEFDDDELAAFFGVEKSALTSRIRLEKEGKRIAL